VVEDVFGKHPGMSLRRVSPEGMGADPPGNLDSRVVATCGSRVGRAAAWSFLTKLEKRARETRNMYSSPRNI